MKHTTFTITNTPNTTNSFLGTSYSKILDNIIASNIIKNNTWLLKTKAENKEKELIDLLIADKNKKKSITIDCGLLKGNDEFTKAANFLANYNKKNKIFSYPFILGKTYKLSDGTPIIFYDDEIQIDMDLYSYSDFADIKFLNTIKSSKDLIIKIYNLGKSKIEININ